MTAVAVMMQSMREIASTTTAVVLMKSMTAVTVRKRNRQLKDLVQKQEPRGRTEQNN